jgi:hypothetical protein
VVVRGGGRSTGCIGRKEKRKIRQDKAADKRQGSRQKTRQQTTDKAVEKREGSRQKTRQQTKDKAADKRQGSRQKTRQQTKDKARQDKIGQDKQRDDKTTQTEGRRCSFDVGGGRARRWSFDVLHRKKRKEKDKTRQGSRHDKTRQQQT